MSSIGKISSSLLSIPAELTVAAVNVNFDFSLLKVEAPKEYHGVRDALSQFRRDEAESGVPHTTARKLGALFELLVPPIPNLLKAYGQRVSDISSKTKVESSGLSNTGFGIFASRAGPDATNIWAAATSGRGAMAVQLLACMLARIWKEHEAISLWVELVECRKLEVNDNLVDGSNIAAIMAAQQTFSRAQLAAWDSSARSWIKTADAERRFQQTQLMLIISNIELPVNSSGDLYDSVIKAWTSAMMAMEKLVQCIPQQIRDGAILLAISSWHLYPYMAVLSEVMKTVEQNDPLMKGSLLTFSAHISPAKEDSNGVSWSLPMAHMRYYSPPVVSRGRLTSDTSRVSMDEFMIVVLGMVLSPWVRTFCADIPRCCRLIHLLWDMTRRLPRELDLQALDWLSMLAAAADHYLHASGIAPRKHSKLLALGLRSQSEFVKVDSNQPGPAFGLTNFSTLLSLIENEKVEEKINFLRHVAQSLDAGSEDLIITYTRPSHTFTIPAGTNAPRNIYESPPWVSETSHEDKIVLIDDCSREFASALPIQRSAQKRLSDGAAHSGKGHYRWILGRRDEAAQYDITSCSGDACGCMNATGPPCICAAFEKLSCSQACHPGTLKCSRYKRLEEFPTVHHSSRICDLNCVICHNATQKNRIHHLAEEVGWFGEGDIRYSADYFQWDNQHDGESKLYTFVLGDPPSYGIFKGEHCRIGRKPSSFADGHLATIDEVEAFLGSRVIKPELLYHSLRHWFRTSATGDSLNAMTFTKTLYDGIPGATVSLEVLKIPLHSTEWSRQTFQPPTDDQYLPALFSCLAMFESGQYSIAPSTLSGVMAMSSHDSIFVASALMSDPSEDHVEKPIKRVFGNMGRSEMVFMIPPADPRFKAPNPGSLLHIDHAPFDGQLIDSFKSTSLHLGLTDFELFLDVGSRGLRDRQAVLLESVITVNDKGMDLGDLDILSAFNSDRVVLMGPCTHSYKCKKQEKTVSSPHENRDEPFESSKNHVVNAANLTSLDCWDELLDPPATSKSIFRATGNWQARLAATAVCNQKGQRVRVLPKRPCIQCIGSVAELEEVDVLIA